MDEFEHLGLIAEISVALLGFVAIFLALSRKDGRFTESDQHFIQALVLGAALAIVLAMAPPVIGMFTGGASIWFWATVLGITLGSCNMVLQIRLQLRMPSVEAEQIHWVWHVVAWGLGISVAVLFVLGLIDSSQTSAYYVSGVSMLVPLCLWVFVGVVFRRFF